MGWRCVQTPISFTMFGWSYCFRILGADRHHRYWQHATAYGSENPSMAARNWPRFGQEPDFQLWRQIFFAGFDSNRRFVPLQRSFKHLTKVPLATSKPQGNGRRGQKGTVLEWVRLRSHGDHQGKRVTFPNSSPSITSSWFRIHFLSCRKNTKKFFPDSASSGLTGAGCMHVVVTLTTGLSRTTPDFFVMTCLVEKWCSMSWGMVEKPVPSKRYWPCREKRC